MYDVGRQPAPVVAVTTTRRPILITGSHRSGTTWVGRTLAAAPGVGYISEPFSLLHRPGIFEARLPQWFAYITSDPDGTLTQQLARTLGFEYSLDAELRALRSPRDAGRMVRDFARCRAMRAARLRPLMKDPIALLSAPWLAETFDMQVVVMIRHPAAFASSLKRLNWTHDFHHFSQDGLLEGRLAPFAEEIADFAEHERPVLEQAALLWSALYHVVDQYRAEHPEWLFVRHEDLSVAPEEGFHELCGYLGLPFGTDLRQHIQDHTANFNPAEAETGRAHQLKRDSRANTKGWRRRLRPDEVELIRERTRTVAEKFYTEEDW